MMQSMGKVLAAAVFVPSAVLVIVVLAGVASAEEDLNGPCAEGERLQDYGTGVYRCFLTVPPYGSYTGTYGDDERGGGGGFSSHHPRLRSLRGSLSRARTCPTLAT